MYTLRPYQSKAVEKALDFFSSRTKDNAIEVLPTGSGKSLVIANIAKELNQPTLIFQPSKEILEQNYEKYCSYGYDAGIYSASIGRKEIKNVTFATIGSVVKKPEILANFRRVIVDECHRCSPKQSMYKTLFDRLRDIKILGLTATPYRLVTDGYGGSILKFLTRTRPRIFKNVIYYINNKELFDAGYLAKLEYKSASGFDKTQLKINSTGADYTTTSMQRYYNKSAFKERIAEKTLKAVSLRKNCLVFTNFVKEAEFVAKNVSRCAIVTAETKKKERERVIKDFKTGAIKAVCNVGILTTGFDYPELETVILARPTMSLALYYQMIGRIIRPHKDKESAYVVDMCDNFSLFGRIEDFKIINGGNEKWYAASNGRQLTNIYFGEVYHRKK